MNTWASYAAGSLAAIVLHSVPPLVVFAAAEAITDLRDKMTEAVMVAYAEAGGRATREPERSVAPRKLFADYLGDVVLRRIDPWLTRRGSSVNFFCNRSQQPISMGSS